MMGNPSPLGEGRVRVTNIPSPLPLSLAGSPLILGGSKYWRSFVKSEIGRA